MSIDWARFCELVHKHQRFLLTSHVRPDCDALGSELGMAGVLESLGKEAWVVNAEATPPHLQFIDTDQTIRTLGVDVAPADLQEVDVLMVLDTSAWGQLGAMAEVLRTTSATKVLLDHHVSGDDLGAELFKDPQAEATGRLVVDAAHELGVRITPKIARPLFAAVATDTGWFRFGSTTANTLRCAAELMEAGARPSEIYSHLYEQDSLPRVQLIGRALARAQTELGGRLVYTSVFKDDFKAASAAVSDTEDMINKILAVAGTEVAVTFTELPGGEIKVSFRSRSPVDVSRVAEGFGGGGHKAAAGATLKLPFEAVKSQVLDAVKRIMR